LPARRRPDAGSPAARKSHRNQPKPQNRERSRLRHRNQRCRREILVIGGVVLQRLRLAEDIVDTLDQTVGAVLTVIVRPAITMPDDIHADPVALDRVFVLANIDRAARGEEDAIGKDNPGGKITVTCISVMFVQHQAQSAGCVRIAAAITD
jgi:hypothetical protein